MTVGERIKTVREKAGITQVELGEKIGVSGVAIMRYEKGQRQPRLEQLQQIALALGTTVNWLLPPENYWEDEAGVGHTEPMPEVMELMLEKRLQDSYSSLTLEGKQKAVDRVEELTEIPRYQAQNSPQPPAAPAEGTNTTQDPEGPEGPQEG